MAPTAFSILNNQLVKAGVKAKQQNVTGSSWMRTVSQAYKQLTPAELTHLRKEAVKAAPAANKKAPVLTAEGTYSGLPLRVEAFAGALGLPIERVRNMYPQLAPQRKMSTRLYTIAARLKVKPPVRAVVKQRYHTLLAEKRAIRDRVRATEQRRTSADRGALANILRKVQAPSTVAVGVGKRVVGEKAAKSKKVLAAAKTKAKAKVAKTASTVKKAAAAKKTAVTKKAAVAAKKAKK